MSGIKEALKNSDSPAAKMLSAVLEQAKKIYLGIKVHAVLIPAYYLFRVFPLQDKIVATTFRGRKYGDNPQFILEELMKSNPEWDYVWEWRRQCKYDVPPGIRRIPYGYSLKRVYEYATAKVWISTHRMDKFIRKRKGQLFIETWHGGLGIKKIEGDTEQKSSKKAEDERINTCKTADVFISNSDHLSRIYRSAFGYDGVIYKCGYPKNDVFFSENTNARKKVRMTYGLNENAKIIVYAPTFRDWKDDEPDLSVYDIDFERLLAAVNERFGDGWAVLVKWHPVLMSAVTSGKIYNDRIINATAYPDMQELIMASDAFISDYSSCIFDAAMTDIPCFTYASDFEEYKNDRGVYYEMEELPFPYAKNNDELMQNIAGFDSDDYKAKWDMLVKRTGLHETGHAAKDIAEKIKQFINGEEVTWTS